MRFGTVVFATFCIVSDASTPKDSFRGSMRKAATVAALMFGGPYLYANRDVLSDFPAMASHQISKFQDPGYVENTYDRLVRENHLEEAEELARINRRVNSLHSVSEDIGYCFGPRRDCIYHADVPDNADEVNIPDLIDRLVKKVTLYGSEEEQELISEIKKLQYPQFIPNHQLEREAIVNGQSPLIFARRARNDLRIDFIATVSGFEAVIRNTKDVSVDMVKNIAKAFNEWAQATHEVRVLEKLYPEFA